MPAFDPTYPLYPIVCILSSALLLLVLATSFARQSWNLGVTFLCFWLFWELLAHGIDAVVWSDNYDVKLYVYCDIVSHLEVIAGTVKPMCTLIIVRRLHLIASLRSVEFSSTREKRNNLIIECVLGLLIPLVVAGPLYYVVQPIPFEVTEGFGCGNAFDNSFLPYILIYSWLILPPLISLAVYYPKVIWIFYRQRRDINRFLRSNNSISRTSYFRILALASVDLLFTLPSGIGSLVIGLVDGNENLGHIPFYGGWNLVHSARAPMGFYIDSKSGGATTLAHIYFISWTSPVLAFIIFCLFGLTEEARATYWRAICFVGKLFGWKPSTRKATERPTLGTMEFGARPQEISLDAEIGSRPSFVNFEPVAAAGPADTEIVERNERAPDAPVDHDPLGSSIDTEHRADGPSATTPPREELVV